MRNAADEDAFKQIIKTMTNENEKLKSAEILSFSKGDSARGENSLTVTDVEKVFKERTEMFASVERYVKVSLREVLRQKIEKEKKTLLEMIEGRKHVRYIRQKMAQGLNPSFFAQKSLSISMFD